MRLVPWALLSAGCLQQLAVDQTANIVAAAAPAIQEEGDYDYAAQAVPAGLVQIEGLWRVSPENELLMEQLAGGYAAYALIFLEDEMEQAHDDPTLYVQREKRVARFFLRGRRYGIRLVEQQNEGFRAAIKAGEPALRRWLRERDEDDVAALFWTGYAWGAATSHSLDDMDLVADFPLAMAIVERVMELDPGFQGGSPMTFLATVYSSFSPAMGGDPEKGKALFERALRFQHRHDLLSLVQYAKTYCVTSQNRELFHSLLTEVVNAPDYRKNRLVNVAAKRRAVRLLAREDELFF